MTRQKPDIQPAHPITDDDVRRFDELVQVWRTRLRLTDWRLARGRGRPAANLAEVIIEPEHRLVRYRVGRDWGAQPPGAGLLEQTVIHELLHVRFTQMLDAAMEERQYNERVKGEEHATVIALSELIYELAAEIATLKGGQGEPGKSD